LSTFDLNPKMGKEESGEVNTKFEISRLSVREYICRQTFWYTVLQELAPRYVEPLNRVAA